MDNENVPYCKASLNFWKPVENTRKTRLDTLSPHWYITLCCLKDHRGSWIRDALSSCLSQTRGIRLERDQSQGTNDLYVLSTREECEMRLHHFTSEIK